MPIVATLGLLDSRAERRRHQCRQVRARRVPYLSFRSRLVHTAVPLAELTNNLSGLMRRVVVDRTGLSGRFDFDLTWTPDQPPGGDAAERLVFGATEIDLTGGVVDPNGAGLLTAVREQLGLALQSTRAPVEVFVVDQVARPTSD